MGHTALTVVFVVVGVPIIQVGYAVVIENLLGFVPEKGRGVLRPWLWLAPALFFLVIFLLYPAFYTMYLSFRGPETAGFAGLKNYAFALTNGDMLVAFRNNLLWLVLFTAITVSFGLLMAVLTDRVTYEAIAKSVLFLPMAISFVAASVTWKFVYAFRPAGAPQIGALNALLMALSPHAQPIAWLVNRTTNNFALILVAAWVWVGFCLVIISASLKAIPVELLEAARMDGATEAQVFWRIIIPVLNPTLTVVTTTMIILALKAFDVVYVMTNGNFNTEVIANRMYKEMFNFRDFGRASAIAVILFAAIVPVMASNIRRFRQQESGR